MRPPRAALGVPARVWMGLPLRVWAGTIAALWGARLVVAWVASRPVAVALAGSHEDRLLFEPGSLLLIEVLRLRADVLSGAAATSAMLLVGAWAALLAVSTGVLARLIAAAGGAVEANDWWRGAVRALPRTAGLALLLGVVGLIALSAFGVVAAALVGERAFETPRALREGLLLGVLAVGSLVALMTSILFDLARAELALGARLGDSVRAAARGLRTRLVALLVQRLVLAALAVCVLAGAATVVSAEPLHTEQAGPLWTVFLTHRGAGALLATLHVSWLVLVARANSTTPR